MENKNIVIAYDLNDSDIEILNRFKAEFKYEVICINNLNELDNFKFMIAFINLEKESECIKGSIEETSEKYKGLIKVIGIALNKTSENKASTNIFENPEKVRLEILKAYQRYIEIGRTTKPFSQRLKRLIIMIRQFENKRVITMDELIKYYHVDRRSIQRDLSFLKEIGVDIVYNKEKKAYILMKEYKPRI